VGGGSLAVRCGVAGSGAEWEVAVGRDGDEVGIESGAGIVLLF
jgi:hypothetical protein